MQENKASKKSQKEGCKPLWTPSQLLIDNSNLSKFITFVNHDFNLSIKNYSELYTWSVTEIEDFWKAVWEFAEIIFSKQYDTILTNPVMPGAKWFEGARLNFAENLLRYRDNSIAIISQNESGVTNRITYDELYQKVSICAVGLRELGVTKGDRVVGFTTNTPEAVIVMLAASSIGAVWSSCSPDFGIQGVLDRFTQIKPKILIATSEYEYNGKRFDCSEKIAKIISGLKELEKTILIDPRGKNSQLTGDPVNWNDFMNRPASPINFEQLPFDHPLYILYSSGTTGVPKCIVHGAGGTLIQHFKELSLHTNVKRGDTLFYFTTCGWMMWNWLVSGLNVGAAIFLYDGSPGFPDMGILWKAVQDEEINVFGTSPKFLSSCQQKNVEPGKNYDLTSLKTILSTGAPLSDENFQWVYKNVKNDVQLSSISGGTDIVSCFMLGNPMLPVYSEEIQCRGLGMKVEAFDDDGNSLFDKKGELVCTKPFPSMPIYFWNDPDNNNYLSAYFDHFPGVWRHGDYIQITGNEGVIVYGRSDATLNPGGVRIGTAEIYRIVESMEEITDSIVVGYKVNKDVEVALFVVLYDGIQLTENLIIKIKAEIRKNLTPRHVPEMIRVISEVPVTLNGKKVELAVSKILNGEPVTNKASMANPESLKQFENL